MFCSTTTVSIASAGGKVVRVNVGDAVVEYLGDVVTSPWFWVHPLTIYGSPSVVHLVTLGLFPPYPDAHCKFVTSNVLPSSRKLVSIICEKSYPILLLGLGRTQDGILVHPLTKYGSPSVVHLVTVGLLPSYPDAHCKFVTSNVLPSSRKLVSVIC